MGSIPGLPQDCRALFTGGGASFYNKNGSLTQFTRTASLIFDEAVSAAAKGETWPLWGTCLGFELVRCALVPWDLASSNACSDIPSPARWRSFIASGFNQSTLTSGFDSENLTLALDFTPAAQASRLFGSMPPGVVKVRG